MFSNGWVTAVAPVIAGDVVTDTKDAVWTLSVTGTSVTLTDANGVTIKPKSGNSNGIQSGSYSWSWVWDDATGTGTFTGTGSDNTTCAYNADSQYLKFRSYKNTTVSGNATGYPCAFTVYKLA